jgi:Carboxypeptidase regulatory-like domain
VVSDSSGALVVGAGITVKHEQTGAKRMVMTRESGRYEVENLEPGEYEILVGAAGFRTEVRRLALRVGDNLTANFKLQAGQLSDHIEVSGSGPGVNATDFKVDGSVGRVQINNLPLRANNGSVYGITAMFKPGPSI